MKLLETKYMLEHGWSNPGCEFLISTRSVWWLFIKIPQTDAMQIVCKHWDTGHDDWLMVTGTGQISGEHRTFSSTISLSKTHHLDSVMTRESSFSHSSFISHIDMAVCQNLVPLVNIKIAGKWMFIPLKMVLIGIDPYPYVHKHHHWITLNCRVREFAPGEQTELPRQFFSLVLHQLALVQADQCDHKPWQWVTVRMIVP